MMAQNQQMMGNNIDMENMTSQGPSLGELENNINALEINDMTSDKINKYLEQNNFHTGMRGGGNQESNEIEQQGGGEIVKAPYRREKNSPYISNDERNVYNKKKKEQPPPREPPVLLEQKIYEPGGGKSKPQTQMYPPAYVPLPITYYPYPNPMYPYEYKPNKIPVQKVYNVSLANPGEIFPVYQFCMKICYLVRIFPIHLIQLMKD